ncbi:MAG: hypothetical protein V4574_18945 [Pseudomonadota bacterium]
MPKFEKLRVSLAREENLPMLEAAGHNDPHRTRTDFLTEAFSENRQFLSSGKAVFRFYPIPAPDGFAAGFFSKPSPMMLAHEDLTPYVAENYETALFTISLDKAQVIWMEHNQKVGSPKRILESFFEHLLRKTDLKDWAAFVRYFESDGDYWDAVRRYRREITKIVFRYVPPNAFEGKKLAQEYHTAVQAEAQNEILEETFKSAPGKMNPESEMMKANAEIAEQGAGEKELRGAGNKLLYASGQGRRTETVPEEEMPNAQNPSFVRRVIDRLFRG